MSELKRMWINQPSTRQPLHHLHGVNVLADDTRVYFLSGPIISMETPRQPSPLSNGWRVSGKKTDRIKELEAKLAKAAAMALEECPFRLGTKSYNDWWQDRRTTLAELTGKV